MKVAVLTLLLVLGYMAEKVVDFDGGNEEKVLLPAQLIEDAFKGKEKINKETLARILYQSYTMTPIEKGEELFDKINRNEVLNPTEELHHHYYLIIQFFIEDNDQDEFKRDEVDDLIKRNFIKEMVDKFYTFDDQVDKSIEEMMAEFEENDDSVIDSNV